MYFFQVFNLAFPKRQLQVKDWHLESCGTDDDALQLQNIKIVNNQKDEILVSGKVNVKTFLVAPVTVRIGQFVSEI